MPLLVSFFLLVSSFSSVHFFQTATYDYANFSVAVDTTHAVAINWHSNPNARRFRTAIRRGVKGGANFAGHYRIVEWGCGSGCQSWVIVDLKTGNIYNGISTSRGQAFRSDSRLILLDPIPDVAGSPHHEGQPQWYEWKNNKLYLLK